MERVRPEGTWDTVWDTTSGYWHSSSSWNNGVPNASAFTYVPEGNSATIITTEDVRMLNNQGAVHIQGELSAGDIRNTGGQIILEGTSAKLQSSRAIFNDSNATLSGHGTIEGQVVNYGNLYATGGTLTIAGDVRASNVYDATYPM